MRTWRCIDSAIWEEWGSVRVCRECGYLEALQTLDGHDPNCVIGNATKTFAEILAEKEKDIEHNRKVRLESWEVQVSEDESHTESGNFSS